VAHGVGLQEDLVERLTNRNAPRRDDDGVEARWRARPCWPGEAAVISYGARCERGR